MCPGESFATIVAALEKAKQDGSPWDCEVQMRAADGRLIWAKVTGEVQYENERPVQIVGVVKDITRRYAA